MNNTKENVYPRGDNLDYIWLKDNVSGSFYYDDDSSVIYEMSSTVMTIFCLIYGITFFVAITGNLMVCYTVSSFHNTRSNQTNVANFFILTLSIDDIILTFVWIPFLVFSKIIYNFWPFGTWMCPAINLIQSTIVLHRAFTLVTITNDCHIISWKPQKKKLTKCKAKLIVLGTLLIAIMFSIPLGMYSKTEAYSSISETRDICIEVWTQQEVYKGYHITIIVVQYFIPLTSLIICYTHIGIIVRSSHVPDDSNANKRKLTRRKTVVMMIVSVSCYAICWTPLIIIKMSGDIFRSFHQNEYIPIVFLVSHCLACANSGINPILYGWMKPQYRKGYMRFVKKVCCWKKNERSSNIGSRRMIESRV